MNGKLKRECLLPSCVIITGDRGTGKSSLFALMADEAIKQGRDVYCQYPYDGVYMIPNIRVQTKGITRYEMNKEWLYSNKFSPGSVILIDEGKTVWPARDYSKWTKSDDEFFNFIRKEHLTIAIATQFYDGLDLNVKRSADETWFLSHFGKPIFKNMTVIESGKTSVVKVADKNTEVIGRAFRKGARKVVYDICEIPIGKYYFYRKPYYGKFITDFVPNKKTELPQPLWNDYIDFNDIRQTQSRKRKRNMIAEK